MELKEAVLMVLENSVATATDSSSMTYGMTQFHGENYVFVPRMNWDDYAFSPEIIDQFRAQGMLVEEGRQPVFDVTKLEETAGISRKQARANFDRRVADGLNQNQR